MANSHWRSRFNASPNLSAVIKALLILPLTVSLLQAAPPPPPLVNRVRFQPLKGLEQEMVGALFSGSNISRAEGFSPLVTVKEAPTPGTWTELRFENHKIYRWLRFEQPNAKSGKLGKVEFYADDRLITASDKGGVFHFFAGDLQDDKSLGFDLFATTAVAQRPNFKPDTLNPPGPLDVTLSSSRDAVIRYTLDGSWPTAAHGEVYQKPLHLDKSTTISAAAFLPDRAPSLLATTTYLLPGSSKPGLISAHIGNSLTGTTGGFWRFARTAGYDHKSVAFLRPGALTRELWAVSTREYAADQLATRKEKESLQRGNPTWEEFWKTVGKVDLLTLQPRDFDLDKEIAAEINFIKLFREKSPDLQPWLYCEWVEQKRQRPSDRGDVPSYQMKKTFPALTWEESMGAMLLYVEELQHRLTQIYTEGKRPRIVPAALAMGWIKNMIDHGQFPGGKPGLFYPLLFNDQVHPAAAPIHGSANGGYLVDMTWYSAFYREKPEGKVMPIETTFTPEQARIVERLAWDVVENYPDCGLYKEGTKPCGKPEFSNNGKVITLKSSTPGAWYRYTLDGTTPARTRGYVYCGVISVQPGIRVKAIAYKSGMADSEVSEAH